MSYVPNYCGEQTLMRVGEDGASAVVQVVSCDRYSCLRCGPRKARRVTAQIRDAAERHKLNRILTLTLDPKKLEHGADVVRYLQHCWALFRHAIRRRFGVVVQFIRVLEIRPDGSHAHLHVLVDRYLSQRWISLAWSDVGGGRIVDIRQADARRVGGYVAKYLAKALLASGGKLDRLLYRRRRVTTSRQVKLAPPRKKKPGWVFSRKLSSWQKYFPGADSLEIFDGRISKMIYLRPSARLLFWGAGLAV